MPYSLSQLFSSALPLYGKSSHQHYLNEWVQLYSNKTLWILTSELHTIVKGHKFFFFSNYLKMSQPFVVCKLYKNVVVNHIWHLYLEYIKNLKLNDKKTTQFKNGQRIEIEISPKKIYKYTRSTGKKYSTSLIIEKMQSKLNEIPVHTDCRQKVRS